VLGVLPVGASHAHGHGHAVARPRVSVGLSYGFGFGYPGYFRPYVYPYYGIGVYPRYSRRQVAREEEPGEVRAKKLYIYPKAGQSREQTADDRYECHVWAVDASSFDPTLGAGTAAEAEDYGRAFTACMEGRDYVVK
jgi:hypothetical protein